MTLITFFKPLTQTWDYEWCDTRTEAIKLIAYYKASGTLAKIVNQ